VNPIRLALLPLTTVRLALEIVIAHRARCAFEQDRAVAYELAYIDAVANIGKERFVPPAA
jgi:hypothetical protein